MQQINVIGISNVNIQIITIIDSEIYWQKKVYCAKPDLKATMR